MEDRKSNEMEELRKRLEMLRKEHRELDERIKVLSARSYLTPDEQVEIANLKKLKLRRKDEMAEVAAKLGENL